MKVYNCISQENWSALCQRPSATNKELGPKVEAILQRVKQQKDQALYDLTLELDKVALDTLTVSKAEIQEAQNKISPQLKQAIKVAYNNIYTFHSSQVIKHPVITTTKGVECFRRSVPIDRVGLYIPGGSAPLFSTLLMLGIPAQIAKCPSIVLCTPCQKDQSVAVEVLYVASLLGIETIYKIGGAQAIAAMAYGTQSLKKVDKIFGPGNQWVTKAKELVQLQGVGIDMPAGPSEVLVIADSGSDADFVASDLLSQCEHGADSQVVLLSNSMDKIKQVQESITQQMQSLPRKDIIAKALVNSFAICFDTINQCIDFSNRYAPEHLIINVENPEKYVDQIKNAGSVFLGKYTCESAGDYASGTNHTLPTGGYARMYSGVSLGSFTKEITFQSISKQGLLNLGPSIQAMALSEGLMAHEQAVSIRLKKINNEK
ncbi:histidinol dehydrogenase [Myroides sp. LJL115]